MDENVEVVNTEKQDVPVRKKPGPKPKQPAATQTAKKGDVPEVKEATEEKQSTDVESEQVASTSDNLPDPEIEIIEEAADTNSVTDTATTEEHTDAEKNVSDTASSEKLHFGRCNRQIPIYKTKNLHSFLAYSNRVAITGDPDISGFLPVAAVIDGGKVVHGFIHRKLK